MGGMVTDVDKYVALKTGAHKINDCTAQRGAYCTTTVPFCKKP